MHQDDCGLEAAQALWEAYEQFAALQPDPRRRCHHPAAVGALCCETAARDIAELHVQARELWQDLSGQMQRALDRFAEPDADPVDVLGELPSVLIDARLLSMKLRHTAGIIDRRSLCGRMVVAAAAEPAAKMLGRIADVLTGILDAMVSDEPPWLHEPPRGEVA